MRVGATNVGKVVDLIMTESGLLKVRNLGLKSRNEIKTVLLIRGYEDLTDIEKVDFWRYTVELNNL